MELLPETLKLLEENDDLTFDMTQDGGVFISVNRAVVEIEDGSTATEPWSHGYKLKNISIGDFIHHPNCFVGKNPYCIHAVAIAVLQALRQGGEIACTEIDQQKIYDHVYREY